MRITGQTNGTRIIAVVTLAAMAVQYGRIDCPSCAKQVAAMPNPRLIEVRVISGYREARGRGPVIMCRHCNQFCEVIEHGDTRNPGRSD